MLDERLDDTDRGAAQSRTDLSRRSEPVLPRRGRPANRSDLSRRRPRRSSIRHRLILLADRLGDILLFAAPQGIFAPDDALQRGHFHDHLCDQVRLGEMDGTPGKDRFVVFQPEHGDQFIDQFVHPLGFIQHGAKLGLEDQLG